MSIHKNYNRLSVAECGYVNDLFNRLIPEMREAGIAVKGDDRAEHAVEAIATWIVESDEKTPVESRDIWERAREQGDLEG